jgi:DNA replication licensing factor MCM4
MNSFEFMQIVRRDEDCFACDCQELASYSPQLYYNLAEYPREVIPILDDILNTMALEIRREELGGRGGADGSQVDGSAATHPGGAGPVINIRPYNLKEPRAIRDLDPNDIEALVQVDGLVTRVSNVMPDMRCFTCILQPLMCTLLPVSSFVSIVADGHMD